MVEKFINGLKREIELRTILYETERDGLLSYGDDVEWKALGGVVKYEQPTKYLVFSEDYNNNYETPGKTFILGYTNEVGGVYQASDTPVIIFDDFTTASRYIDFDFKVKSSAIKMISAGAGVMLKFIYYHLNNINARSGDHVRHWIKTYTKIKIPIPSLEDQQRVVEILDKLTAEHHQHIERLENEINYHQKSK